MVEGVEGRTTTDVIDEESSDCGAVVGTGDGSVGLLACCVPDLQFDGPVPYLFACGVTCMFLEPNSTPMVGSESTLNSLSMNCMSMQDLPTPVFVESYFGLR